MRGMIDLAQNKNYWKTLVNAILNPVSRQQGILQDDPFYSSSEYKVHAHLWAFS
jgi:hypothetical protein